MTRVTKGIFIAVAALISVGLGSFGWNIYGNYRAIREGRIPPSLERRLQASFTRVVANARVTDADLKLLASSSAPTFGTPDAKLTIVEFIDFDCPFCRATFVPFRALMEKYKDHLFVVMRDFPIEEIHPRAFPAALAARCAQEQGAYWSYHDKLYVAQERHEDEDFYRSAREMGLNETRFTACYQNKKYAAHVQQDLQDGLQVGVQGTPTFFFNGIKMQGALDQQTLEFLIQQFLKR